jgi:hypothetical protein
MSASALDSGSMQSDKVRPLKENKNTARILSLSRILGIGTSPCEKK